MMRWLWCAVLWAGALWAAGPSPDREKVPLKGAVNLVGSDSMEPLVLLWFGEFQKAHPQVELQAVSKGSATAPPALVEGRCTVGPMSRAMTPAEEARFEQAKGYKPTQLAVAFDALAVWVHKDNPVFSLSLDQLDAIYSASRKAGWDAPVARWGDVGACGQWARRRVVPINRNELSGTRSFFQERVLLKGDFQPGCRVAKDQWDAVELPGRELGGVSYGPLNYAGPGVRMVPVSASGSNRAYRPTPEHILSGKYPLSRTLYFYVDKAPGKPLPEAVQAFLAFVQSPQGQALAASYGCVPVPSEVLLRQNQLLGAP